MADRIQLPTIHESAPAHQLTEPPDTRLLQNLVHSFAEARREVESAREEESRALDLARVGLLCETETGTFAGSRATAYALQLRYVSDPRFRAIIDTRFDGNLAELTTRYFSGEYRTAAPAVIASLPTLDRRIEAVIAPFIGAIQLSEGCSIGCHFCGLGAKRDVGSILAFEVLHYLLTTYGDAFRANETFLYWASDPFDYEGAPPGSDRVVRYEDLARLALMIARYAPFGSTAVPQGREEQVRGSLDVVDRISISSVNRHRLARTWPEVVADENVSPDIALRRETIKVKPDLSTATRDRRFRSDPVSTQPMGIGCIDGVLLTPKGFFNVVQVSPSDEYIEGQIVCPIDTARFDTALPDSGSISDVLASGAVEFCSRKDGSLHQRSLPGLYRNAGAAIVRLHNLTGSEVYCIDSCRNLAFRVDVGLFDLTRRRMLLAFKALHEIGTALKFPSAILSERFFGLMIGADGARVLDTGRARYLQLRGKRFFADFGEQYPTLLSVFEDTNFRFAELLQFKKDYDDYAKPLAQRLAAMTRLVPRYAPEASRCAVYADAFILAVGAALDGDTGTSTHAETAKAAAKRITPDAERMAIASTILGEATFVDDARLLSRI